MVHLKEKVHHFWFKVIKLWELSVEDILQTGLTGVFPLMILAKDGKRPEVVEQIIQKIKELLSLAIERNIYSLLHPQHYLNTGRNRIPAPRLYAI